MENNDGRELLENVTITDVNGSPYIMQRMDNSQLLSTDLLQHHNGIVVDLGAGDFIPVNYSSDDLLSQDLTEEDRNLAAALVAVQLSQQQKQQQIQQESSVIINTSLPSLVNSALGKIISYNVKNILNFKRKFIDPTKVSINEQQLMLADKNDLNNGFLHIVDSDNIYKQTLPKFLNVDEVHVIANDEENSLYQRDSDCDNR